MVCSREPIYAFGTVDLNKIIMDTPWCIPNLNKYFYMNTGMRYVIPARDIIFLNTSRFVTVRDGQ